MPIQTARFLSKILTTGELRTWLEQFYENRKSKTWIVNFMSGILLGLDLERAFLLKLEQKVENDVSFDCFYALVKSRWRAAEERKS